MGRPADRSIDFIVWQSEIPVTWFQAFNPFMIFTFTPLIITFWTWHAGRAALPGIPHELEVPGG